MRVCDYCSGPLVRAPLRGRPWPEQPPADYCCYGCLSLGEQVRVEANQPAPHGSRLDWRLALSVLIAGQAMTFSLAINWTPPPADVAFIIQGILCVGALLVLALLGGPLLVQAVAEAKRKRLSIEGLFLLALVGALAASLLAWLERAGPIYFEIVAILLVVYTIGSQIGAGRRARALTSAKAWAVGFAHCRLLTTQGPCRDVAVTTILPDDVVEVRPGEMIGVDGIVVHGTAFVSEAARTGEPFAAVRRVGDRVWAGSISQDALLHVRATVPGTARQIDTLLDAVAGARLSPTSMHGQADRAAAMLLPCMVVIALGTFLFWTGQRDWHSGLMNALAVLLVACPCALGLATPIVVWSSLGRLAQRGLISRDGTLIERLAEVDTVVFDKTGTLTEERYGLVDLVTACEGEARQRILHLIAAVERRCNHPLARAFHGLPYDEMLPVTQLHTVAGCGVTATVAGQRLRIGRVDWLGAEHSPLVQLLRTTTGQRLAVEIDGQIAALAVVAERLRESAPETLADLAQLGVTVEVLTGDSAPAALAVNTVTGLLPEQKQQQIAARSAAGHRLLFVGDGINDAPALTSAHVGIALASGTDLALHASTATLYDGDLRVLPWAVALCRQSVKTVRFTLAWAVLYNVLGITLAASGLLHPLMAAVLMTLSSLGVAWFATRLNQVVLHPEPANPWRWGLLLRAAAHATAIVLQGLLLAWLFDGNTALLFFLALIVAALLVWGWAWGPQLPHLLDMNGAMLTVGNAGMLAGWWADNGFRPITMGCCNCSDPRAGPWMWLGMLVCGNAAMLWLPRLPCQGARWVRLGLENVGMVLGMVLGGLLAQRLGGAPWLHLLGMTAGMLLGMNLLPVLWQITARAKDETLPLVSEPTR